MMRLVVLSLVLVVAAACGGSTPPAAAPSTSDSNAAPSAPAPAPSNSPASAAAPGSDAPASTSSASSVESQREPFMQGCMKKVQAPDYCECGFDQFRDIFKGADMSKETPDNDPRFAELQQRTMTQCASKLPEEAVKAGFMTGCAGGEPRKAAYCQCAWPALRKTLSTVDFVGTFEGPRFEAAKKTMVTSCKGKFPTELAKSEFMTACTKGSAAAAGKCACVWTKLRAKYSTEEIAAGMADISSTPGVDKCQ